MSIKKPKKNQTLTIKITQKTLSLFKGVPKSFGKLSKLHFKKNNCLTARLGIIIPKKTVNLAVTRNKIRRKLREEFKKDVKELGCYDILIVITDKINSQKESLGDALIQEWEKLKKYLLK